MNSVNSVKISDILWDAANIYLWDGVGSRNYYTENGVIDRLDSFSCDAVNSCLDDKNFFGDKRSVVIDFIFSMGVDTGSLREFIEVKTTEERQQCRYAWLMFAYQYAVELEEAGELAPIEY